jgi:hypothetical protein
LRESPGFVFGVIGILGKSFDFVFGDAALGQVMDHKLRDPRIGAQTPAAGDDHGRHAMAVQFRRALRTVGVKIVIAQDNDGVRALEGIFHNPGFTDEAEDRGSNQIKQTAKDEEKQHRHGLRENSTGLTVGERWGAALFHEPGSRERRYSAACSGKTALK